MSLGNHCFRIGVLNRPHSNFFDELESDIFVSGFIFNPSLIVGNFNVDVSNQSSYLFQTFNRFCNTFSLSQLISSLVCQLLI